jgi:hypothetical protein
LVVGSARCADRAPQRGIPNQKRPPRRGWGCLGLEFSTSLNIFSGLKFLATYCSFRKGLKTNNTAIELANVHFTFMKTFYLLLAAFLMGQQLQAQLADGNDGATGINEVVSCAPLPLFITGAGKVVPFEDGQMLEVGRSYHMIATPDRGYVFTIWVPVNVFYSSFTYTNANLGPGTITNISVSPQPEPVNRRILHFTMQPEGVIFDRPVLTLTASEGWQANFVPEEKPVCSKHSPQENDSQKCPQ